MEQASIWCFFSIAQIGVMLYLIRDILISRSDSARKAKADSASKMAIDEDAPYLGMSISIRNGIRGVWGMM